jgi:hypothetical protein
LRILEWGCILEVTTLKFNPMYSFDGILGFIGSFLGVLAAFWIAKWSLNKTMLINNQNFVKQFNTSVVFFNRFLKECKETIEELEKDQPNHISINMNLIDMKKYIDEIFGCFGVQTLDNTHTKFDLKNDILSQALKDAPPFYYRDIFGLFFKTIILYNQLVDEYTNRGFEKAPTKINYLYFPPEIHYEVVYKDVKKSLNKVKRKLKI